MTGTFALFNLYEEFHGESTGLPVRERRGDTGGCSRRMKSIQREDWRNRVGGADLPARPSPRGEAGRIRAWVCPPFFLEWITHPNRRSSF